MPTYEQAPIEARKIMEGLKKRFHKDLVLADVTIDLLFAHATIDPNTGEPKGVALKRGGYQVAGLARIVSHKDRVAGRADAEIVIDGDAWAGWSETQQRAIVDHELQHLAVKWDRPPDPPDMPAEKRREPEPERDDGGRPKLKLRLHDHEHGWFDVIAERHGSASVEVQQAAALYLGDSGQRYFGFLAQVEVASAGGGSTGVPGPMPPPGSLGKHNGKERRILAAVDLAHRVAADQAGRPGA